MPSKPVEGVDFGTSLYIFATYEGVSAPTDSDRPKPMPSLLNYPAYLTLSQPGVQIMPTLH